MFQYEKILTKIEELVDKLPYKSVKIEIETDGELLTMEKTKSTKIGFI